MGDQLDHSQKLYFGDVDPMLLKGLVFYKVLVGQHKVNPQDLGQGRDSLQAEIEGAAREGALEKIAEEAARGGNIRLAINADTVFDYIPYQKEVSTDPDNYTRATVRMLAFTNRDP